MHKYVSLCVALICATSILSSEKDSVEQSSEEKVIAPEQEEQQPAIIDQDSNHIYSLETIDQIVVDHKKEIIFGMLGSFSAHFRLFGEQIKNGILAYFKKVNTAGGIKGKKLRLVVVEDYSDPEISEIVIARLRKKYKISMFIGNMGTRSIAQVLPKVKRKRVALFFPWAANDDATREKIPYIVNGLGDMSSQVSGLTSLCINRLHLYKIAIFHSDGSFSTQTKDLLITELEKYGVRPVAVASYNRFTMDIRRPSNEILKSDPKVVICLASSYPTSKMISHFFEKGHYGTKFMGVDSTLFVSDILQNKGAKYLYSSTVPNPSLNILPITQKFRRDYKEAFPDKVLNILSFSYYIHARIVAEAIERIEGDTVTKEKIIEQIEQLKHYDMDGFMTNFDPETRMAYPHKIYIIKE